MESTPQDRLTKIEHKLDMLNNNAIEKWTAVETKLDIYLNKQDDHELRLRAVEDIQTKQDGINEEAGRKRSQIVVWLLGLEIVLFGVGLAIAHFLT